MIDPLTVKDLKDQLMREAFASVESKLNDEQNRK
jgi:hypothetical protein